MLTFSQYCIPLTKDKDTSNSSEKTQADRAMAFDPHPKTVDAPAHSHQAPNTSSQEDPPVAQLSVAINKLMITVNRIEHKLDTLMKKKTEGQLNQRVTNVLNKDINLEALQAKKIPVTTFGDVKTPTLPLITTTPIVNPPRIRLGLDRDEDFVHADWTLPSVPTFYPVFSGKNVDVEEFIIRLKCHFTVCKWPTANYLRVIGPLIFTEDALRWFDVEAEEITSMVDLCRRLRCRFAMTGDEGELLLKTTRQGQKEKTYDVLSKVERYFDVAMPRLKQSSRLEMVIKNTLRADVADAILILSIRDFDEALKRSHEIDLRAMVFAKASPDL